MKAKDLHKCDLFIEHAEVGQIRELVELAQELVDGINHSLFDKQRRAAQKALLELRRAVITRHDELGNTINPIFERWSNDELA